MKTFIEDYLYNPSEAIARAAESFKAQVHDNIDDDAVYLQLSTPEFRLYEEIIFAAYPSH